MIGRVVSIKMQNTAAVLITRTATHALYKKTYVQSKKFLVQDDLGVKLGDIVELIKIKPVSKRKHWKVVKVIGRDIEEIVKEQLQEKAAEEIAVVMPAEVEVSDENLESSDEKIEEEKPKVEVKKKGKSSVAK